MIISVNISGFKIVLLGVGVNDWLHTEISQGLNIRYSVVISSNYYNNHRYESIVTKCKKNNLILIDIFIKKLNLIQCTKNAYTQCH